jgi:hypothetical protein
MVSFTEQSVPLTGCRVKHLLNANPRRERERVVDARAPG